MLTRGNKRRDEGASSWCGDGGDCTIGRHSSCWWLFKVQLSCCWWGENAATAAAAVRRRTQPVGGCWLLVGRRYRGFWWLRWRRGLVVLGLLLNREGEGCERAEKRGK